jgi:hypothetical protein
METQVHIPCKFRKEYFSHPLVESVTASILALVNWAEPELHLVFLPRLSSD